MRLISEFDCLVHYYNCFAFFQKLIVKRSWWLVLNRYVYKYMYKEEAEKEVKKKNRWIIEPSGFGFNWFYMSELVPSGRSVRHAQVGSFKIHILLKWKRKKIFGRWNRCTFLSVRYWKTGIFFIYLPLDSWSWVVNPNSPVFLMIKPTSI